MFIFLLSYSVVENPHRYRHDVPRKFCTVTFLPSTFLRRREPPSFIRPFIHSFIRATENALHVKLSVRV